MQRFEHIFPFFSTHFFGVSLKVLAHFSEFDYVGEPFVQLNFKCIPRQGHH